MQNLTFLQQKIQQKLGLKLNRNQFREIKRLAFEISKRDNISLDKVLEPLEKKADFIKFSSKLKFFFLKNTLIKYRFPQTSQNQKIDQKNIFLSKVKQPLNDNWQVKPLFKPLKIFVETDVIKSQLLTNFQKKFPDIEVEEIDYYSRYVKTNKFTVSELKKPLVFIVKERSDL